MHMLNEHEQIFVLKVLVLGSFPPYAILFKPFSFPALLLCNWLSRKYIGIDVLVIWKSEGQTILLHRMIRIVCLTNHHHWKKYTLTQTYLFGRD